MTAVTVEDLIRRLDHLQARGPIPFDVKSEEILGVLCTSGHGRRTLIAILMTVIFPIPEVAERSSIAIFGGFRDMRREMGVALAEPIFDPDLTVRENLEFHARMHGLGERVRRRRITEAAGFFDLAGCLDAAVSAASPATVRRIEIARACLTHPSLLLLAEPTKGLDESGRREIWDTLRRLNRERSLTIVLTTESLDEAAAICHRAAVIDGREVVALDTPEILCAVMGISGVPLRFDGAA